MTFKNRNDQYNVPLFSQRFVLYIDFFFYSKCPQAMFI